MEKLIENKWPNFHMKQQKIKFNLMIKKLLIFLNYMMMIMMIN